MPSEWKFEIRNVEEVEHRLIEVGASLKTIEQFTDVYFETDPNTTLKIRIFSNHKTRVISFKRNEEGAVSDLVRTDYESLHEAKNSLNNEIREKLSLHKIVKTYVLEDLIITIHAFENQNIFLCVEPSNEACDYSQIFCLLESLGIDKNKSNPRSFDEILLSNVRT